MSTEPQTTPKTKKRNQAGGEELLDTVEFLSIMIDNQMFGIPVLQVQDVLREQNVTQVPLAPPEVAGALNLRGRIVTAINVRKRLGLPDKPTGADDGACKNMSVVVEHDHELYSLIIDKVGDVLALPDTSFESVPPTIEGTWREIANGIFRLDNELMIVIDVPRLLRQSGH